MKEKEIRDRIQGFLKRTARTVVVPASVGLGLSAGACDRTSLHGSPADAATDAAKPSDAALVSPDTNVASPDLALGRDLPELLPPYMAVIIRDALPDLQAIDGSPDAGPEAGIDLAAPSDVEPDSRGRSDAQADVRPDAQPDLSAPPPPYMVPPFTPPASPGGTAPVPPKASK